MLRSIVWAALANLCLEHSWLYGFVACFRREVSTVQALTENLSPKPGAQTGRGCFEVYFAINFGSVLLETPQYIWPK